MHASLRSFLEVLPRLISPAPRGLGLGQWLPRGLSVAAGGLLLAAAGATAAETALREIVVTNDFTLPPQATLSARLVVRANHVTIDGQGATLVGPGRVGDPKSLEEAGVGVRLEGVAGVTLKNLKARGFALGLLIERAEAVTVSGCHFSDNYHNPKHGWGELSPRGGILLRAARHCVLRNNRANRVWDGLHLVDSDDNWVAENDFSDCSNTCAKLWKSSRNKFLQNNFSRGLRIDRAAGEVHARDSACVLLETGSDDNYWYRNDMTHGGDGIFIRPLNRWVSRGNVFVENDTSWANNNCVESWSPGNIFIRNKANHGSYGFWLGGSDHTVLLDNEAAYNGLTNGHHHAPEAGFGHGGLVIVGGPATHTLIAGNHLHHNHGAGLAFRGDEATKGRAWRIGHWVVQQNRIEHNRFGLWGRWADALLLAGNTITNNTEGNFLTNVSNLIELPAGADAGLAPAVELLGPEVVRLGDRVRFDASRSRDPLGRPLTFHWWLERPAAGAAEAQPTLWAAPERQDAGPVWEHVFDRPGFHRLSLTAHNGALAGLAWRDLLVVPPVAQELGTEGEAGRWSGEQELDQDGRGRVLFADDPVALCGTRSLRLTPDPYRGAYATAVYPATRDAGWNLSGKSRLRFWIKALNPNVPGWQNPGPVVRLLGRTGHIELKPAKGANLLNDPPFSEARWLWMPVDVPLAGDARWERTVTGQASLERIEALSLSLDSWGGDPFTVWLDGLTVE